jgi:hypothetical protein
MSVRVKRYSACSFGLSATSQQYFSLRTNQPPTINQQYFSLRTNQPPTINQQYFSLRTNQHQPSATSQTNRLIVRSKYVDFQANVYISIECNKNSGTQFKSLKDIIDIYRSNARAFC